MPQILNSKFGFLKHCFLAFIFSLGCYLVARADPATTTALLISLAIAGATTGAQFIAQKLLTPKPKPVDKNKIGALDVQASYIGLDTPIAEIYGGQQADGNGGFKLGVNFFYLSDIRHVVSQTQSNSGGGKGGSRKQTTNEHHYYQDIAGMVGFGELDILQIAIGTKILYKNNPKPIAGFGTKYEAESATLSAGAVVTADAAFSNGAKVVMASGATITFSISGDGAAHTVYIYYSNNADQSLTVSLNGSVQSITLPNSFGTIETVTLVTTTVIGATTIILTAPQAGTVIDRIAIGQVVVQTAQNLRMGGVSGIRDANYINPSSAYSHLALADPTVDDPRPTLEFNYQANLDSYGSTVLNLPAGCVLRTYSGNATQLPDPLIQAYYSGLGLGCPAYRYRCYFMLENFEITEYSAQTPQITVVAQHKTIRDLGSMYAARAKRTGLTDSEIDFSAFNSIPLRGFGIVNIQPPKTEMAHLNDVLDIDIIENSDGVITGVVPDETVTLTLNSIDLDPSEGEQSEQKPTDETLRDSYELPKELTVTGYNPLKDWEIDSGHTQRQITASKKQEKVESGLVLLPDELQRVADRIHQKRWTEKDPVVFTTFPRHGFLKPTDLVKVQALDGSYLNVRIHSRNGAFPYVQKFAGKIRNVLEPYPRIFNYTFTSPSDLLTVDVPNHTIGTIIDVAILRTNDVGVGFYAACARTDSLFKWNGATLVWQRQTTAYEVLTPMPLEATIGRTVTGSGGTLGNPVLDATKWDVTNSVTFDLFAGSVQTRTDAEVLDRFNAILIGNELIAFTTATRVNGFPNRWTISRLRRTLRGTVGTSHGATERVVLLDDAVKFIPLDISEFDKTHNYKFVSSGQDVASASRFSFTWSGRTKYNTPADQVTDAGVPVLSSTIDPIELISGTNGKNWRFKFRKPVQNGYSANKAEYRLLKSTNPPTNTVAITAASTSITLSNVTGFPASGKIYLASGETVGYDSISGTTLNGLHRAIDDAAFLNASSQSIGGSVYLVTLQGEVGNTSEYQLPQLPDDYVVHYRWTNAYRENGSTGVSGWAIMGTANGSANAVQPPAPTAPPAMPPAPPVNYQDPLIPPSRGRYKDDFSTF